MTGSYRSWSWPQSGDVWERSCTVSKDVPFFSIAFDKFQVYNPYFDGDYYPHHDAAKPTLASSESLVKQATYGCKERVYAKLDGKPLPVEFAAASFKSDVSSSFLAMYFAANTPDRRRLQSLEDTFPALSKVPVADAGFYFAVPKLSPGKHVVEMGLSGDCTYPADYLFQLQPLSGAAQCPAKTLGGKACGPGICKTTQGGLGEVTWKYSLTVV